MNLFIGCSSSDEVLDKYKDTCSDLLKAVAKIPDVKLVFGAAMSGLMKECADSFAKEGKEKIGVSVDIYKDDTDEKDYNELYFEKRPIERTKKIYDISDVILFIPGGFGTLSEFFTFVIENEEMKKDKLIIIYNKDYFYTPLLEYIFKLREEKFIRHELSDYFFISNDIEEIVNKIKEEGMKQCQK